MEKKLGKSGLYSRLLEDLRRDKKRAVILAVLAVTAAIVVVRAVGQTSVPASAGAAVGPAGPSTPASDVRPAPPAAAGLNAAEAQRDIYLSHLDPRIKRDLFAISDSVFPPVAAVKVETVPVPSATQPAEPDAADVERKAIIAQAQTLKLQGVIVGANPSATISDKAVCVGGKIQGFEVESISEDSCILRKKDIRVTLVMKQGE